MFRKIHVPADLSVEGDAPSLLKAAVSLTAR